MRLITFLCVVIFLLSSTGCDKINKWFSGLSQSAKLDIKKTATKKEAVPEVKGTVLAKVNDRIITLEEFQENIKTLQSFSQEVKLDTLDAKRELLREMINQELLYQEAKLRGIQNRETIKKAAENYLRGLVVQQLILDSTENVTIESQEIESFYNQYKDQFAEAEQRKVREIVLRTEEEAKQLLISLLQGADFNTMAREKSIGKTKDKEGDLGFIKKGDRGTEYSKFDEIVFSLGQGEISNVFKCPEGYCIVKVEQIKEGKPKLLTEIWDSIKETLLNLKKQQKYEDLIQKLRQNAKIETNDDILKYSK